MIFDQFIHKSLPKNLKLQNKSIYNFGSKNIFLFSDFVFDPFLHTKTVFLCFFDNFLHKSLPKNVKLKNIHKYEVFDKIPKSYSL